MWAIYLSADIRTVKIETLVRNKAHKSFSGLCVNCFQLPGSGNKLNLLVHSFRGYCLCCLEPEKAVTQGQGFALRGHHLWIPGLKGHCETLRVTLGTWETPAKESNSQGLSLSFLARSGLISKGFLPLSMKAVTAFSSWLFCRDEKNALH